MTDLDQRVARIKADYEACFACGTGNPIGLQIGGFESTGGIVSARFTPRADYCGFEDVLHGGIIATALDEMLGWTAILLENVMVVTAKLELRYTEPAPVAATYRLTGALEERRGKRLLLRGECRTVPGKLVASASGLFLVVSESLRFSPLQPEPTGS
jgi:acyl-coenzyme A thioesterase PaaI-like protein